GGADLRHPEHPGERHPPQQRLGLGGRRLASEGSAFTVPVVRMPDEVEVLEVGGREVIITHPGKVFFPKTGHTKLQLVNYYAAVAEGAVRGVDGRPMALKRFVEGAGGEPFFQKRAPNSRPNWIAPVELTVPAARTAAETVVLDLAQLH